MAFNYTDAKRKLDDVAQRTGRNMARLKSLQATAQEVENDLNAMTAEYSGLSASINAEATASPLDGLIQDLKAEKNKLVADFQALKSTSTSVVGDLSAYDFAPNT